MRSCWNGSPEAAKRPRSWRWCSATGRWSSGSAVASSGMKQDVEDVFQATFLILARKAAGDSLAGLRPWMVECRGSSIGHACAVGVGATRRRETSITALTREPADGGGHLPETYHPAVDASAEVERRDLRGILDDELRRLPEKYRAPVVLCYLEGRTHEEAARQLGWPAGSMSRRLDRARSLLRRRLAHRGLAIAAIGLVSAAFLAVSIGRAPDQTPRTAVVQEAMSPFQPASKAGQGFGSLLAALTRSDDPPLETESVVRLARQAARSARAVKEHDPGVLRACGGSTPVRWSTRPRTSTRPLRMETG